MGIGTLRADRIVELTPADRTFEVSDDFDFHGYLARQLHTHPRVSTRLRLPLHGRTVAASYQQIRQEGNGD